MTEREIIDAGIEYTMANNPICFGGDAMRDMREFNRNTAFEDGAKWVLEKMSSPCNWCANVCSLSSNEVRKCKRFRIK